MPFAGTQGTGRGFSFKLKTGRVIPRGHARPWGGTQELVRPVGPEALWPRYVLGVADLSLLSRAARSAPVAE